MTDPIKQLYSRRISSSCSAGGTRHVNQCNGQSSENVVNEVKEVEIDYDNADWPWVIYEIDIAFRPVILWARS